MRKISVAPYNSGLCMRGPDPPSQNSSYDPRSYGGYGRPSPQQGGAHPYSRPSQVQAMQSQSQGNRPTTHSALGALQLVELVKKVY